MQRGLVPAMNATKWKELAVALQSLRGTGPTVRVKYVADENSGRGFTHFDWEWLQSRDSATVEWLEIDPVFKSYRGRLIPDAQENMSAEIEAALRAHRIPFSREGSLYRIWGYVHPGSQPAFV